MKPVLALDLDEIIFPFMHHLLQYVNDKHNSKWTIEQFHTFEFDQVWGGTPEEARQLVDDFFDELADHPEPIEGSTNAIETLAELFSLHIVTARHDTMEEKTLEWVARTFPGTFDGIHLCNFFNSDPSRIRRKVEVCEQIGAVALVDDSLKSVTDVAVAGQRGILFGDFTWNRTDQLPEGVTRACNWQQVVAEVKDLA